MQHLGLTHPNMGQTKSTDLQNGVQTFSGVRTQEIPLFCWSYAGILYLMYMPYRYPAKTHIITHNLYKIPLLLVFCHILSP